MSIPLFTNVDPNALPSEFNTLIEQINTMTTGSQVVPFLYVVASNDSSGVTDTAAVVAALSALQPGQVLYFVESAHPFYINPTTIPDNADIVLAGLGTPTIKPGTNGGTTPPYIFASYQYSHSSTSPSTGNPCHLRDLIFVGANNCPTAIISMSWNSFIERINVSNFASHGFVVSNTNSGGSAIPGTIVNNVFSKCKFWNNGGDGLRMSDSSGNTITDMVVDSCYMYGNTGQGYGASSTWAGCCFVNNHLYGNGIYDIDVISFGIGSRITNNQFETGVRLQGPYLNHGVFGPGNIMNGPITVLFNGAAGAQTWVLKSNTYKGYSGSYGYILHYYFDPSRVIVSEDESFDTNTPFQWSNGSSTGIIYVRNGFSANYNSSGVQGSPLYLEGQANATGGTQLPQRISGTFTANGTTAVVVSAPAISSNSSITFTLKTIGGTPAGSPYLSSITPGTGFSVKCASGDTSTYNWTIVG